MKILYGVQGTGNGHLSRARAMARALRNRACRVDWLFSGRAPERYFDMQAFGAFQVRRGLTFVNRDGTVDYLRTVLGNSYGRFLGDVLSLDLSPYDLVVTDFEPITAWAGRLRRKPVVSLGHQPAFDFPVPTADRDLRTVLVMRLFAPARVRLGMHWDPFGAPLLPPLIDVASSPVSPVPGKVLVYLPFENQSRVIELLRPIEGFDFYIYAPDNAHSDEASLHLRPTSLSGFRADLHDSCAVLCNAGFELGSECLALGKRLLVKPQGRQMEQASNALALQLLGYGDVLEQLDGAAIARWLRGGGGRKLDFPDVADALARWLLAGDYSGASRNELSERLWRQVRVDGRPLRSPPTLSSILESAL